MKSKSVGVSTSELVILALHRFETENPETLGCTADRITRFISDKYDLDVQDIEADVHAALFRGLTFGIFTQNNGEFRLEEVPKLPTKRQREESSKLGSLIVEANNSNEGRKRRKRTEMEETSQPWIDDAEKKRNNHLAKKRRGKSQEEDEDLSEDENYSTRVFSITN